MARFTHETHEDKQDLIAKAWKCKPKYVTTHATHQGWEQRHKNGNLELLVSFGNLDKLLEGATHPELIVEVPVAPVGIPVVIEVVTPVEVIEPVVEPVLEEESIEDESSVEEDAPKKRGRPKAGA